MHVCAQTRRRMLPVRLGLIFLMMSLIAGSMLLGGCASTTVPSGTDAACDALRPSLPTVSTEDARETRESILTFYEVFTAVCE